MSNCKKCGSNDINITFIKKDVQLNIGTRNKINNEFVYPREWSFGYDHFSKKEHLVKHCKTCQYSWRENTLDAEI